MTPHIEALSRVIAEAMEKEPTFTKITKVWICQTSQLGFWTHNKITGELEAKWKPEIPRLEVGTGSEVEIGRNSQSHPRTCRKSQR